MNIAEMHVWFRQYAQQMGMQNVRAILPEQIDSLINTSTKDVINEIVHANIGTTNDRVITDNAKLSTVNALRTLYKVKTIPIGGNLVKNYKNKAITFTSDSLPNALYFVDFSIRYTSENPSSLFTAERQYLIAIEAYKRLNDNNTNAERYVVYQMFRNAFSYYVDWLDDKNIEISHNSDTPIGDYINNTIDSSSSTLNLENFKNFVENTFVDFRNEVLDATTYIGDGTRLFPVRIINEAYLADILNDWILSPRMRTPVMAIYSDNNDDSNSRFELYLGENDEEGISELTNITYVYQIRCSYIKEPNKVRYASDLGGTNVNSDLPEQLQIPMLKHAVDLYRISIQGNLFANQQNNQAQQQEIARNETRPTNDGYQS